jgi:hypothetical protein
MKRALSMWPVAITDWLSRNRSGRMPVYSTGIAPLGIDHGESDLERVLAALDRTGLDHAAETEGLVAAAWPDCTWLGVSR